MYIYMSAETSINQLVRSTHMGYITYVIRGTPVVREQNDSSLLSSLLFVYLV